MKPRAETSWDICLLSIRFSIPRSNFPKRPVNPTSGRPASSGLLPHPGSTLTRPAGNVRDVPATIQRTGIPLFQRLFEPQRFDRLHRLRQLNRGAQVILPMAVDHDVVVPSDCFPAILEALPNLDQFFGGEHL